MSFLRTLCLRQDSKCFSKFSGKRFLVLVNFELMFGYDVRKGSEFGLLNMSI